MSSKSNIIREYQYYPWDKETEEDLKAIQSAQRTLRLYRRRFQYSQQCIITQMKGKSLIRMQN